MTGVAATGAVTDAKVYRNDKIPEVQSGGISVLAAHLNLLTTVSATIADGTWFNAATGGYPTVVHRAATAQRLGIGAVGEDVQIYVGGELGATRGQIRLQFLSESLILSAPGGVGGVLVGVGVTTV